jgi:hypothetical protein
MAAIALSFWLLFAFADDRAAVADFLGDAANDLSNGNANGFLKRFDRKMPGYGELEAEVQALVKLAGVSSAAQVLELRPSDGNLLVSVDWFVELKQHGQDLSGERRRELVQVTMKRAGKGWQILTLEPRTLFAAPRL